MSPGVMDEAGKVLAKRRLPALCGGQLGQPAALTAAYAAAVRSLIAVFTKLNEQVKTLEEQVREHFGRHPDAEIYRSQPGMGAIAPTSPITRASGKKKVVAARGNLPQSGVAA